MRNKALLCLLLALSLLAGPAAQAVKWEYPVSDHPEVDYEDMLPVTGFDETELVAALEELESVCGRNSRPRGQTRQRVQALYDQILSEMNVLITKEVLSSIQYDAGGGAPEAAALYLELSNQSLRLFNRCYEVFSALAVSSYRDVLDTSAGEDAAQSLLGYEGLSEEDAVLREEVERLTQEYDQILSKGVSVEVAGRSWTLEALESEADEETYWAVSTALEEAQAQAAGELYRELVRLRTEIALAAGYSGYTAYAYRAIYNRDYTLLDAKALWAAAKEYILPLQLQLAETFTDRDIRALDVRSRKGGEELLDDIQPFVREFDREMGRTFAFMREHHLYDIAYAEDKLPTSYTQALPAYGSAFIFLSPYGNYQDYSDLIHEFGHFNETFHCVQHELWANFNIDVGEIHSQALELMFTSYAGEIFGERCGKIYRDVVLYNILDSILEGCLYDEFQTAVYENPELSVEELNRLFKTLSEEYGYSYEPGVDEDSYWVQVSHNFHDPLYFISYATSALSALDLWFLYLDSPRDAKEVYLELSALSLSLPYREAVSKVGLRDIFNQETIPALAETLEHYLDGDPVSYDGKPARREPEENMVFLAFGLAGIVFILWLRARPSRRERAEKRHREAGEPWAPQSREDPWSSQDKKPPWEL